MRGILAIAAAASLVLAACGGEKATEAVVDHSNDALPSGMTVKQQIEARQHNLKDMGGAFKTINDQLKTDAPQLAEIRLAATEINGHAQGLGDWFPATTGPESGVKTEAKAEIWSDNATFVAAAQKLKDEAAKLVEVTAGEDVAAIKAQAGATGGACKGCHDKFRQKKE